MQLAYLYLADISTTHTVPGYVTKKEALHCHEPYYTNLNCNAVTMNHDITTKLLQIYLSLFDKTGIYVYQYTVSYLNKKTFFQSHLILSEITEQVIRSYNFLCISVGPSFPLCQRTGSGKNTKLLILSRCSSNCWVIDHNASGLVIVIRVSQEY